VFLSYNPNKILTPEDIPDMKPPPISTPQPLGWPNAGQLRLIIIFAATVLGIYLCYLLTLPFLAPLTWALVLGITCMPLHRQIELRVGNGNIAALISVAAVTVLVVVPVIFVAQQLITETANGAVYLQSEFRTGDWREPLNGYPTLSRGATWLEQQLNLADTAGSVATWLTTISTSVFKSSVSQLINVILTFYILFFLLRDRKKAKAGLIEFSALSPSETDEVIGRFIETIHATVFGTVIMAAVQGTLGGLMFWWLGLPLPLLWGVIMAILAIVPVLGAFVIWIPAAIYLALEGHWAKALILAAWGGIVVASIDNLLYPTLVGNRLKLHTVLALIASFGGLIVFGASGLILGPAVVTTTLALMKILKNRFSSA
jgi:predicted PurR-regulated permease PerM